MSLFDVNSKIYFPKYENALNHDVLFDTVTILVNQEKK
jgi:hypothetical protein